MNIPLRKWLMRGSITSFILSLAILIGSAFYTRIDTDNILFASLMILILSISVIVALISLRFENNRIFRKIILVLTLLLPVFLFVLLAPEKWIYVKSDLGTTILIISLILSSAAAAVYVFILSKPESVGGMIIIVIYLAFCIILKQIYEPADSNTIIVFGFFMFGPGMVMYGIRALFIIKKNNYLRFLICIACLLVFLVSWEFIWINPDSKKISLVVYSILIFLTTLIVLLSLPFSGYIQWDILHKRILNKLIIPWVFVLLIVSARFIFPDLGNVLFREKQNNAQEFGLRDYEIINKNGLESEHVK